MASAIATPRTPNPTIYARMKSGVPIESSGAAGTPSCNLKANTADLTGSLIAQGAIGAAWCALVDRQPKALTAQSAPGGIDAGRTGQIAQLACAVHKIVLLLA